MQELPLKLIHAWKLRAEAFFVTVITAAHIKEVADQAHDPSIFRLRLDRPARVGRRPGSAHHPMSQSDVAVDAIVCRGLADIIPDGGSICDRLVRVPWPKRKSEGVHIRIGPDARITEEIPRSADGFA